MATRIPSTPPPHIHPPPPHANQILVTISVENDKLAVYPRREDDAAIYWKPISPEKPQEVCWIVEDLPANRKLRIVTNTANPGHSQPDIFNAKEWEIVGGKAMGCVESGPVVKNQPTQGTYKTWKYDVELWEIDSQTGAQVGKVDVVDPTVVIKTDP